MSRLVPLFSRRKRMMEDLDRDIRDYIERETQDNIERGMPPEEARYAALRKFGNVTRVKEDTREVWTMVWLEQLWRDVLFGLRQLRRSPGFTAVVVLTLALGIGANTAIFSLIDAVLLKALPVENPQQLVLLDWTSHGFAEGVFDNIQCDCTDHDQTGRIASAAFSYPIYEQIRDRNHVFSRVMALAGDGSDLNVEYKGEPSRADGELVSGTFFSTLGVRPAYGRLLAPEDDRTGASPAAVISYGYWERRLGRDPGAIGQTVTLNSLPFTIVGVSPPEFYGVQPGRSVEIWLPLHAPAQVGPGEGAFQSRLNWWVLVMGRLRPDVTDLQARTELEGILQQSIASDVKPTTKAETIPHLGMASVSKGLNNLRREFSKPLFILMAVVGLVLMIACANVANLMLARATSRQKEIAVRLAVGAGRGRLVRQLLTENVVLAGLGGAAGLVMAFWGAKLVVAFMASGTEPLSLNVPPDPRVLGFTAAVSVLTGILFGLSPGLGSTRMDLTPVLKESAGAPALRPGSRRGWRLGEGLVVTQVSLSIVLLVGAGLFVRTLANISNAGMGFNPRNLLLFGIDPTQDGYQGQRVGDFYLELARRIEALPGVRSVSLSENTLVGGGASFLRTRIEGQPIKPGGNPRGVGAYYNLVGPRFFETMGIPLVLGRTLGEADTADRRKTAVVNGQFARQFLGGENPIGRRFDVGSRKGIEIVGVVGDAKFNDLSQEMPPTVYLPSLQYVGDLNAMHFEVRTAGDPVQRVDAVRRVARDMDPRLALYDVRSQTEQINQSLFQQRLFARLTSFFAALAALIACVGIYGVMAFAIARRTREIGIRAALGASRAEISGMILRETGAMVAVGTAIGVVVALGTSRLISSFLYGLKPSDPVSIAVAVLLMAAAAGFAGFLPARRAAKVDPMVALRHE